DIASPRRGRWYVELIGWGAMLVFCFLCARGGWHHLPLQWGDSVHDVSPFANHLALNGIWSLAQSAIHRGHHDQLEHLWAQPVSATTAEAHIRDLYYLPGEVTAGNGQCPLLRTAPTTDLGRTASLNQRSDRPINVVVILMESFSARFVGAVGSDDDYTPH